MKNLAKDKKFALIAGVGLILVGLVRLVMPHNDFPVGQPRKEINFEISDGASGTRIANDLVAFGVIMKSSVFIKDFTSSKIAQGISPGVHLIHTHITSRLAIAELLDQKRVINSVKVIEGNTLSDVLKILKSNSHIDSKYAGLSSIKNPFDAKVSNLEGVTYPANYSFPRNTKLVDAVSAMVSRFSSSTEFASLLAAKGKYSPYQLLIIASMVQIEGDSNSYERVAQVIFNRLAIGMPLQLNSTVQYAAGLRGKIALSNKSTQISSPFNTYRNQGLPPTPISIAGPSAIKATLHPMKGNWLYFITVKPGDTRFTNSFSEFSKWNTEFNNNVANGVFK